MKLQHYHTGKHPMVRLKSRILGKIVSSMQSVDPSARLVPTRFGRRRSKVQRFKIKLNPQNAKEIFLEINGKGFFQRFKIECSSVLGGQRVLRNLREEIS